MFPTRPRFDPPWVRELGLEPDLLDRVREEVHSLQLNDGHPGALFGRGTPADEARRLRRRLGRRSRWLDLAIPLAMLGLGYGLRFMVGPRPGLLGDLMIAAPQLLMILGFAAATVMHLRRGALNPYYATVLRKHGIVVCPRCGYRAAGLADSTVCTECGLDDPLPRPPA